MASAAASERTPIAAAAAAAMISSMADSLTYASPESALLALAADSEATATRLTQELDGALGQVGAADADALAPSVPPMPSPAPRWVPPLPDVITSAARSAGAGGDRGGGSREEGAGASTDNLGTALSCSESILSSLTKVASGGSKASTEMRGFENDRRRVDIEADAIAAALRLRLMASGAADALGGRRYADAARLVADFDQVIKAEGSAREAGQEERGGPGGEPSGPADAGIPTPLEIAGLHTQSTYEQTRTVLRQSILERYEQAIAASSIHAISELTPLLGLLDLADKGVGMYLRYSQSELGKAMSLEKESQAEVQQRELDDLRSNQAAGAEPPVSRAEQRRRIAAQQALGGRVTVCTKLAKVYNAGVTHLRHHLPMVTYALGAADGDAALVQLVHLEVEKRAVSIMRDYADERGLPDLMSRAERVSAFIDDRYVSGTGADEGPEQGGMGALSGEEYGPLQIIGVTASASAPDPAARSVLEQNDCGFRAEVGRLADVDSWMDEAALLLQHTESYERFVRHACDEVNKARKLRLSQTIEEERKRPGLRKEGSTKIQSDLVGSGEEERKLHDDDDDDDDSPSGDNKEVVVYKPIEILPPTTQLNDIVSEVGGYYSNLERSLLLASMQRAFQSASFPDERNYTPLATMSASAPSGPQSSGCRALQTSVVEECLYASQRSTLRAFATGHVGTARAVAKSCIDALGRVVLSVLTRRAELAIGMLKPGEGLLVGPGGFGQAAFAAVKGLSRAKGASQAHIEAEERALLQQRIAVGVSRACANVNDLDVAIDYSKTLGEKFMNETHNYPRGTELDGLRACIKGLDVVGDQFRTNLDRTVEVLIETLMPRVRSIVNDAIGQESTVTTGATAILGGSSAATVNTKVRLNYELDDAAYELAQVIEGYMSRLCGSLDEILNPLRLNLAPRLADTLILGVLGGTSRRLESVLKRSKFTALGAISLDSDVRYFVNYAKSRIDSTELTSNMAVYKACGPMARLVQIALLMNVDDLEDVVDLIASSKRKGNWDLKLDDTKALLSLRVEFEGRKVNELLRMPDDE